MTDDRPDAPIIELPEHRAIYISVLKVASSSMLAFMAHLLRITLPENRGPHSVFYDHPWLRREDIANYPHHWKFCVVRNPWDRLVSCYRSKIKSADNLKTNPHFKQGVHRGFVRFGTFEAGMPFDAFVRAAVKIDDARTDPHLKSQYAFLSDDSGALLVDYIGKFERLNDAFEHICDRLGVTDFELPHLKKADRREYHAYYTPELVDLVGARYQRDVELFGYSF